MWLKGGGVYGPSFPSLVMLIIAEIHFLETFLCDEDIDIKAVSVTLPSEMMTKC